MQAFVVSWKSDVLLLLSIVLLTIFPITYFSKDCDMPEHLKVPGNRPEEAEADAVDVMEFLNLKRAPKLEKTGGEKDVSP